MLIQVTQAELVGPYSLRLSFNDGTYKRVNLRRWLNGPVFIPLREPAAFARFNLDGETVTWPDFDVDLAPEFLYELESEPEPLPAD
jgi:hypothetical protein